MAVTTADVHIRMDANLKRGVEETCQELGMNVSTAFTIFAAKLVREKRIPFEVSVDPFYSEANLRHLERVRADAKAGLGMAEHDLIES
jgi:DNA-damage-inducible protein J